MVNEGGCIGCPLYSGDRTIDGTCYELEQNSSESDVAGVRKAGDPQGPLHKYWAVCTFARGLFTNSTTLEVTGVTCGHPDNPRH